jgi:hypothetical protein
MSTDLIAYFDESGTDGQSPLVAVAGYLSTKELWKDFENEWQIFLSNNNIEIFHATNLINGYKEFSLEKGWSKKRRESAIRIADRIIEKHVLYGLATYTTIEDCEKVFPLKDKNGRRKKFSAEYLISGVMAVNLVTNWAKENNYFNPIKLVFEDGAQGKGYLSDATKPNRNYKKPRENLMGKITFEDKNASLQLQAADRLVHFACKSINKFLIDENSAEKEIQKLNKLKLENVHCMDAENFPDLARKLNLDISEIYQNDY